jgi:hypothetical protein
MKSMWLLTIVLLLLTCGCSRKERSEARPRSNDDQPRAVEPEEQAIKAATPEDPGSTATVVVPLEVLKKQSKPLETRPEAELPQQPLPVDRPVHIEPQESKNFLHKVFPVSKHAQFTFLVPPHQGNTRLRGNFRSFTKRSDPNSTSDRTAAVDLMLLNEQEFDEFLHGRPQSVTYELDSANNQRVDWRVPTTYGEPQTYYLVFSNPASGTKIKFVEADFTVSFE